eukprot:scaffold37267_cov56-Attheya_sp.AAC.1
MDASTGRPTSSTSPPPTKRLRITPYASRKPSTEAEEQLWHTELGKVIRRLDEYPNMNSLSLVISERLGFLEMDLTGLLVMRHSDVIDELHAYYNSISETVSKRLDDKCNFIGIRVADWKRIVELRAAILHSPLKLIPGTNMQVYRGVPDMETQGMLRSIVIRPEDKAFWNDCITMSLLGHRVCGVGNPGIGKTTTSFHLIRELIMTHKRTVVFAVMKNRTVYYELVPRVLNGHVSDIDVNCHPPRTIPETIECLQKEDAYYIPDPGKSKKSCDVDDDFIAHFVMAASNDERHWGGHEFTKKRGGDPNTLAGDFVYSSQWTESDMLSVKDFIGLGHLSNEEISVRYRAVGGSVRA